MEVAPNLAFRVVVVHSIAGNTPNDGKEAGGHLR